MVARSWSCMAPVTISAALAVFLVDEDRQLESVWGGAGRRPRTLSGTLRPRTVTIFCPGRRNSDAILTAAVTRPPGLLRRSRTSPARRSPPSFSMASLTVAEVFSSKLKHPDVADARRRRRKRARRSGTATPPGVRTSCIVRAEPGRRTSSCACCWRDCVSSWVSWSRSSRSMSPVDGQNFVARRQSSLGRRSAGQRLQHDHAPGQHRYHAAEALAAWTSPMLLELLELPGVEEDGMRIERAQKPGDGALVEGLLGGDGIGGVLLTMAKAPMTLFICKSRSSAATRVAAAHNTAAVKRNINRARSRRYRFGRRGNALASGRPESGPERCANNHPPDATLRPCGLPAR